MEVSWRRQWLAGTFAFCNVWYWETHIDMVFPPQNWWPESDLHEEWRERTETAINWDWTHENFKELPAEKIFSLKYIKQIFFFFNGHRFFAFQCISQLLEFELAYWLPRQKWWENQGCSNFKSGIEETVHTSCCSK